MVLLNGIGITITPNKKLILSNGYSMLNIKAKDKLAFNQMMIDWYDNDDIVKAVSSLFEYYQKQIAQL